MLYSHVA